MIVLDNAKIVAKATPEFLFNNPKNALVASFFGEFNELDTHGIVYANQLKVTKNSNLEVVVKQSYFKGSYYLIEGLINSKVVFFEHAKAIKRDTSVCLMITK